MTLSVMVLSFGAYNVKYTLQVRYKRFRLYLGRRRRARTQSNTNLASCN